MRTIKGNKLTTIQRSGYYKILEYRRNIYKYLCRILMMYGYYVCEIDEHRTRKTARGKWNYYLIFH